MGLPEQNTPISSSRVWPQLLRAMFLAEFFGVGRSQRKRSRRFRDWAAVRLGRPTCPKSDLLTFWFA